MVTRAVSLAAVSLLLTATVFGCAKRPAMTQASAPPPAVAPAPMAAKPAPPPPPVVVQETVKETVTVMPAPTPPTPAPPMPTAAAAQPAPTTRPAPKEFAVDANVKDIFFDFDKYNIKPEWAKVLDADAAWLKANPGQLVLIEGHCDERGTNEYNLALGERRAKATMNYLVSQGVQANRITIISYGEERPACNEKTESCWSKNRRAHFLVKPR